MTRAPSGLMLLLLATSCLDRMILDGTIKSTRDAAAAFDTLSDLEVARTGAAASIVQLEGMLTLAPDNLDALYLLTQSWAGYGGAFIEDEWEAAVDAADEEREASQAQRAVDAYDRAVGYGTRYLEQRAPGFVAAQRNADTMKAYLARLGADDAELLLWLGAAWLSRGSVGADRPALVAELFVGVALLERSVELEPGLAFATGLSALGAYHARAPDAELPQARALFEQALAATGRKALTVQLLYAQTYACNARDRALYEQLLGEVLSAGDVLPAQRLENVVARRKAARYLRAPRLARCGF